MKSAIRLVAGASLRRQNSGAIGLAMLVALSTALVLTSLAGARRTATSFERFREEARAWDAWVQVDDEAAAQKVADRIGSLPMVTAAAGFVISPTAPLDVEGETADFALMGDTEGRLGVDVGRPRLLAGRVPRADAVDEVLVGATAAEQFGWIVGDRVAMTTFSPADIEAIASGGVTFLGSTDSTGGRSSWRSSASVCGPRICKVRCSQ
ncbi:MAG: hypothetical protein K1X38_10270 [Microthrixaceae bacterium]|nr:hypothetical protein [Microthrixaceae bacterium]